MLKRSVVSLSLLILAGCGDSPKIDASSDSALVASISSINKALDDDGKRQFADDCSAVIFPDSLKVASRGLLKRERGKVPANASLFKKLDGLTASEVHDRAKGVRRLNEAFQASGLAPSDVKAEATTQPNLKGDRSEGSDATAALPVPTASPVKPPDPKLIPDPDWIAKTNDTAILFDREGKMTYFCEDLTAWCDLADWSKANNETAIAEMVKQGRAGLAEHGTSVLVLTRHLDPSSTKGVAVVRVRMLDGIHAGKTPWVAAFAVVHLIDPQIIADAQEARDKEAREKAAAKAAADREVVAKAEADRKAQAKAAADQEARTKAEADRKAQADWEQKIADIYPVAKKALSDARKQGEKASATVRKAAIAREVEKAASSLCKTYQLTRPDLDRLMNDGKAREDQAKKKQAAGPK